MAFTSRPITVNESTAGLRTVFFGVWNTADGTAKTDLAAATALIHTNSGAGVASTNNFSHVSNGRYALVLTQAETNLAIGTHLTIGPANGAGYVVTPAEVVIVPANVSVDNSAIATAVWAATTRTLSSFGSLTTDVRNAILNWEPYTGYTLARLLRAMGIVIRGTAAITPTSATFTAPTGGSTVSASVDVDGNRTVVNDTASNTP